MLYLIIILTRYSFLKISLTFITTYSYGTACYVSIEWGNYLYFGVKEGFVEEVMFMLCAEGWVIMGVYLLEFKLYLGRDFVCDSERNIEKWKN